jgi:hypothetical protein
MSAFDSVDEQDGESAKFYIELAGNLLVDSIARINQRIKDGLLEAVNAPELSSKRRRRSTFLREDDMVRIDRAREVNQAILSTNYRADPRRYGNGADGKGGKGGHGKGGHGKGGRGGKGGKGRWWSPVWW